MKKLIKVTQKHIDNGIVCNTLYCPVALAVRDIIGVNAKMGMDLLSWTDWDDGERYRCIEVPRSVKRFVTKFDMDGEVKPFNFILDIPD